MVKPREDRCNCAGGPPAIHVVWFANSIKRGSLNVDLNFRLGTSPTVCGIKVLINA